MEAATAPPRAPEDEREPDEPGLEGEHPEDEGPEEPIVEGTEPQLTLAIGGRKPESSVITLQGGELKVRGQFKKGERLRFVVEGVVDEVGTRDKRDRKTNTVTSTIRKHYLTIEGFERL